MSNRLDTVISIIKQAGSVAMEIYNSDFEHELKADESPLTQADLLANQIITDGLLEHFDYPVISEEVDESVKEPNQLLWLLDPIDGTKDFVNKTGEFSIMLALMEQQKPILGVVYVPAQDTLYYAEKGKGAFRQISNSPPQTLKVSSIANIADATLVRSRNHFSATDQAVAGQLKIQQFKKLGSVGIKFGAIAAGEAELCYYCTDRMGVWDDAASDIILTEAGGAVFTIEGKPLSYDLNGRKMPQGIVGTNNHLNKQFILETINHCYKNQ